MEVPIESKAAPPPVVEPLLLTPEEAAEALAIGRTKVYELVAAGELESVRIGRSRRVPLEALHRFVESLLGGETEGLGGPGNGRIVRTADYRGQLATGARGTEVPSGHEAARTLDR
jgi:excisionase family DNA binding protein